MNGQPEQLFGVVPLTQAIMATWGNADIQKLCNPSAGLTSTIAAWELYVYAKHDLHRLHGIPK